MSPAISNRRTLLRPYTGSKTPLLLPILSDPTTMSFWPNPLDESEVVAWVERDRDIGGARTP